MREILGDASDNYVWLSLKNAKFLIVRYALIVDFNSWRNADGIDNCGCSNNGGMANRVGNANNVDGVIDKLIEKAESVNNSADLEKETSAKFQDESKEQDYIPEKS